MILGRSFMLLLWFQLLTAVCLLLLGHVKSAEFDKLKQKATLTMKQAVEIPSVRMDSSRPSGQSPPNRIEPAGAVKVSYVSATGHKLMTAYYSAHQLSVIDYLDLKGSVVRREILDAEGRSRIKIFFNDRGEEVQMDYLDENGKRIDRYTYVPPAGFRPGIY